MCAQATIIDETAPQRLTCLAIVLLAVSVFTLGLHVKLALYKPLPPSMLVTLTKLALNERSDIATSTPAKEPAREAPAKTSRPTPFEIDSSSLPAQTQREAKDEDGLCAARHHLKALLLHKPPPASSLQVQS